MLIQGKDKNYVNPVWMGENYLIECFDEPIIYIKIKKTKSGKEITTKKSVSRMFGSILKKRGIKYKIERNQGAITKAKTIITGKLLDCYCVYFKLLGLIPQPDYQSAIVQKG